MPAPHPLRSLASGGPDGRALAVRRVRTLMRQHGGDVRAAAAALDPPVHETTLHDWLVEWDLTKLRQGRGAAAKKKSMAGA